jgi:hypothetical protein
MVMQLRSGSITTTVVQQHVDKILHSGEFGNSETLRNLLSFLARHAIEKPGEVVKEYELATGVLGRAEGFDPRMDSAVRVHTGRLRAKLAEYYMSEGTDDPILIEVPKGSYQLSWRPRAGDVALGTQPVQPPTSPLVASGSRPRWHAFLLGFGAALVLAGLSVLVWAAVRTKPIPAIVEDFWSPFLSAAQPPIVVFSNHRFAGNSATGLRHFREGIDSPADSNDTYSGTGTVMAVGELSSLFSLAGRSARLKRAELLTWDEAKDANVVFVGSPDANVRLRELAPLHYFRFKSAYQEPSFGVGGIINVEPRAGEQPVYLGPEKALTFDYVIIAMLPNVNTDRKVMILAATNTYGCQAAADFVKDASLLRILYSALGVSPGRPIPDFEALIRVGITGGVPLQPQLVTVRTRGPSTKHSAN